MVEILSNLGSDFGTFFLKKNSILEKKKKNFFFKGKKINF